jgi:c-di-GMP-binding flagellar brake protein YcgR
MSPALPHVNQLVALSLEGSNDLLSSRVEEVGEGWVALAPPSSSGGKHELREGAQIELQWITPRGLGVARATVRGADHFVDQVVLAEVNGDAELVQRRDHVRTDDFARVVITPLNAQPGKQAAIGTTLDVAGGGVRARVPQWLEPGELVRMRIKLADGEQVVALARAVRRIDDETVAFSFEQIGMSERERVVRHVFRRLRQALKTRETR